MGKGKGNKSTGETVIGARFLSQGRIVCQTGQVGFGKTIGLIGSNQAVENRTTLHGSQLVESPAKTSLASSRRAVQNFAIIGRSTMEASSKITRS